MFDQNLTATKAYYVSIKPQGDCGSSECVAFYSAAVTLPGGDSVLALAHRGRIFNTMGPAHNGFGHKDPLLTTSRFLYIKIIDSGVKKFGYKKHRFTTCSFFLIFLLVVSETQCSNCVAICEIKCSHIRWQIDTLSVSEVLL